MRRAKVIVEALCVLSSNLWVMVVAAVMSVVTDLHDVVLGTAKDTRDLKIVTISPYLVVT